MNEPEPAHEIVRSAGDRDFAVYLAKLALDLAAHAGADPREVDAVRRALTTVGAPCP